MTKRFGASFTRLPASKRGFGSPFMQSFEVVKRDFGITTDDRIIEIGPLRLTCDDPYYYDDKEYMVRLTK